MLRFSELSKAAEKNDYITIINKIQKNPSLYGKQSEFLYYMDIGTLYHYALMFDSSNFYLDQAAKVYDNLFTKSVTNEAASLLINDNVRPYRSKPYELVLMHQFMMFNYMAKSQYQEALVESKRLQLLVDEWQRSDKNDKKYSDDGFFQFISSYVYASVGQPDDASISLFKSIQAYQKQIIPLPDYIRDCGYATFIANNREGDIKLLNLTGYDAQKGVSMTGTKEGELLLVGYAGRGPILSEDQWWGTWVKNGLLIIHHKTKDGKEETVTLPAPGLPDKELEKAEKGEKTESGTTFHIKFSTPIEQVFDSKTRYFTIQSSSFPDIVQTSVGSNLDKLCIKYLEDMKNEVMLRTVVRVVLRTIASQRAKKEMETSSPVANLLINVGTDILADQLEQADIRTSFLIPKTIHFARIILKPGTHTLQIKAHDASGGIVETKYLKDVAIKAGERKCILYPLLR